LQVERFAIGGGTGLGQCGPSLRQFVLGLLHESLAGLDLPRSAVQFVPNVTQFEQQPMQLLQRSGGLRHGDSFATPVVRRSLHPRVFRDVDRDGRTGDPSGPSRAHVTDVKSKKAADRPKAAGGVGRQLWTPAAMRSRKPFSWWLRTGCCSLRTALASI